MVIGDFMRVYEGVWRVYEGMWRVNEGK